MGNINFLNFKISYSGKVIDKNEVEVRINLTTESDDTPPTISNGTLTTSNITGNGFTVNFTEATDNVTLEENLEYFLYTSDSDNLNTDVSTVESNGQLVDQGTNVTSLEVTGLNSEETKYFNIVVSDESDNKAIYISNSETTLDVIAPTLTNATATATGEQTLDSSVDTDEGTGILYWVVTQSETIPDASQIIAGTNHTDSPADNSGNQVVSSVGTQNISVSGLSVDTTYYVHYIHEDDANNQSNTISTSAVTTPDETSPTISDATLSTSSVTNSGFIVDYNKSTDNVSAQTDLIYRLYSSSTNNLDTVSNTESNGTLQDTGTDVSSLGISGLDDAQTIWFNIIVEDEAGNKNVYTQNSETTLDSTDPTISNKVLSFSNVGENSLDVNFNKATDNYSSQASLIYKLYRASSGTDLSTLSAIDSNGTQVNSGTDVTTLSDSGLSPLTTYEYNITVEDEAGNRNLYTQNSQQTTDETSPTVSDSTLSFANITETSLNVNYTEATDNITDESNLVYTLYRASDGTDISTLSAIDSNGTQVDTATNISTLSDSGLTAGTSYEYNVVVEDGESNRTAYTQNSVTTTDNTSPTVSDGTLSTSSVTETGFLVDFVEANDNITSQSNLSYNIYSSSTNNLDTVSNTETNGSLQDSGTGVNTLSISGLSAGETIWFNIVVEDEAGNKSIYTQNSETTTDETSPTISDGTLTFSNIGENSLDVNYTEASDNVSDETNLTYTLYRASEGTDLSTLNNIDSFGIQEDTGTNVSVLSITGLNSGTTYEFNVVVEDEAGNRSLYTQNSESTIITSTTALPDTNNLVNDYDIVDNDISYYDTESPTISSSVLTFNNITESSLDVSFEKAEDNETSQVNLEYKLYRASQGTDLSTLSAIDSNGTQVNSGTDVSILSDSGLNAKTTYEYNVTVEDLNNNRTAYTQNSVTTTDETSPTVSDGTLSTSSLSETGFVVDFTKANDNVSDQSTLVYTLYSSSTNNLDTVSNTETNGTQEDTGTDVSSLGISGLSANETVWFNIVVEDEEGNKNLYTQKSETTPDNTSPTISDGTLTTSSITDNGFTVNYNKATDNVSAQSTLIYTLYSSTTNNLDTVSNTETNGTQEAQNTDVSSLSISGKSSDTTYYFNIIVKDEAGNKNLYTQNSESTSTSVNTDSELPISQQLINDYDIINNDITYE